MLAPTLEISPKQHLEDAPSLLRRQAIWASSPSCMATTAASHSNQMTLKADTVGNCWNIVGNSRNLIGIVGYYLRHPLFLALKN